MVDRGDRVQLEIVFLKMMKSDVAIKLNVFDAFMEDIIMSNVGRTEIITIEGSVSGL